MPNQNRTATQAHDAQIIVGIKKDLQQTTSLPLAGETYTPASFTALLQSRIDAGNAVAIAKANWQKAVETYNAILSRETDQGTNTSSALQAVFDMARWRLKFVQWQTNAEAVDRAIIETAVPQLAIATNLQSSISR